MNSNRIHETELTNAVTQLLLAVRDWEKSNLLVSPINGRVAFMQLWEKSQYVNGGETVFVIVAEQESQYKGKALLPMQSVGKVKIGQRAIVRQIGISEQEHEFVEGKVISVSPVPDEKGNYVMEIGFPDETELNNSNGFPLVNVLSGKVEVIIKDRSLLERLIIKKIKHR